MREVLAIIGLLTLLCTALLLVLVIVDGYEQRRWMSAYERQERRREARSWGHKS